MSKDVPFFRKRAGKSKIWKNASLTKNIFVVVLREGLLQSRLALNCVAQTGLELLDPLPP